MNEEHQELPQPPIMRGAWRIRYEALFRMKETLGGETTADIEWKPVWIWVPDPEPDKK